MNYKEKGNSITKRIINVIGGKYPKQGSKYPKQGGKYPKYASLESSEYNNTSSLNNTISKNTSDKPDYLTLFNEFYKLYPKKTTKKESTNQYNKILKENKYSHEFIINALKKQIEWRENANQKTWLPEWQDPIRWLKNERWNDEVNKTEINTQNQYRKMDEK